MKSLPSNKILLREYCLSKDELFQIMNNCISYFLSEEELQRFIFEYYEVLEKKINKKYQLA